MTMRVLALVFTLPTLAFGGTTITLSDKASADLAVVSSFAGHAETSAWLGAELDRVIAGRIQGVREAIIDQMKQEFLDSLTTAQILEMWKTRKLPTPFPTATPKPTLTPLPTSTPEPTATSAAPATPPTPTPKGHGKP